MPIAKSFCVKDIVNTTPRGLYCPAGDFYVDPREPVTKAVVTHAHSDHAREGMGHYFAAAPSLGILNRRVGEGAITAVPFGKKIQLGDAKVSFHPAGHILGSAQIRIEAEGQVWVVSGDYKRSADPSCEPFEVVECDTFITEATFGLPIYRWQSGPKTAREILEWWDGNVVRKKPSVLFCYSLGKAQRMLAELSDLTYRRVFTHGAVENLTEVYREAGIRMLPTERVTEDKKQNFDGELILAPPSAYGSAWMRRFPGSETGFASGWMTIRGNRRRRGYDRGFALSDHADWPELLQTISQSKAKRVLVTHGYIETVVRYLREQGLDAESLETTYQAEGDA